MLELLQIAVTSAKNEYRHIKILKQLTLIMSGSQPQRVDTSTPPRVAKMASTLNNTTALTVVRATKQIQQQATYSNTPMPSFMEVEEPMSKENEQEKQQHLINQPTPLPPTQQQLKAKK